MFIDVANLKKSYEEGMVKNEVLKGIVMSLNKEEIGVILGPSGFGKSTLMNKYEKAYVQEDASFTTDKDPEQLYDCCRDWVSHWNIAQCNALL